MVNIKSTQNSNFEPFKDTKHKIYNMKLSYSFLSKYFNFLLLFYCSYSRPKIATTLQIVATKTCHPDIIVQNHLTIFLFFTHQTTVL